jgi:PhnB protein
MKNKKVNFIPKGYNTVTPYLSVDGAADAISFYKKVFGAKEIMRMPGPNGRIGHAEIAIGDCRVMLADEFGEINFRSPKALDGSAVHLNVYVKNAEAVVNKAVAAGAKLIRPTADQFYGDRSGSIQDPFGHVWHIATHIKDVSMKDMKKQSAALAANAEKK